MAGGSAKSTRQYCGELLGASFSQAVLPAALASSDAAADNALSMVAGMLTSLSKQGTEAFLNACIFFVFTVGKFFG